MTTAYRVLIDARLPWGSGIGRYVRNIVSNVAARMRRVSFTLLVSPVDIERASALAADRDNVIVTATSIAPFSLSEQTKLPALAHGYDLTWFTNYWVPLRWSGRFVTTVHDLIHLEPSFPASTAKRIAAARTFAKVRHDAAHIIFDSRFSARVFEQAVGIPRAASVVHLGIDHAGTPPVTVSMQERGKTALSVAAAKKHKNLPLLLNAWRKADLKDWQLTLVTPNDDLRSSIDLTEQVARMANVRILRGISDADLDMLYANAGFVLVPSRYEGFGLPLLEAMRAGAPVISSTAPSLVEVASGALIPFVDPSDEQGWVQAIRDMATRCETAGAWQSTVSARNRTIAEGFTWSRAGADTADILGRVLAGEAQAPQ